MEDEKLTHLFKQWRHIFKLDPAKEISDEKIQQICKSKTDAIIVGGTDHVTSEGVLRLLVQIKKYDKPCILEISTMEAIVIGFDYYFVPMVMNSKDKKWMMDLQHKAVKKYRPLMNWDFIFTEGYCILNEDSKAYIHTNCRYPEDEDVLAYAHMAEHMFRLPIFYLEYSGTYGNPQLVKAVKEELDSTLLFYGGGIQKIEQAEEMMQYADVIVVGNSLYTHFEAALQTTEVVDS